LPYTANVNIEVTSGSISFSGITKANYTNFNVGVVASQTYMQIYASGSGQNLSAVNISDFPSGTTVILDGEVEYMV
jgi:hypothetical protein